MTNNYEEINKLIEDKNNKESISKLIIIFEPYLGKYLKLITKGMIDFEDKDTKRFIALFSKLENIRKIQNPNHTKATRNYMHTIIYIINKLCKHIKEEEWRQELNLILITLIKRYKEKKINFCGYLYNTFKYELYRSIKKLTKDPLIYQSRFSVRYNDDAYETEYEEPIIIDSYFINQDNDLSINWVDGHTCSKIFNNLNTLERHIIKLSYHDKISDIDIGRKFLIHRNTVRKYRENAIEKVKLNIGVDKI